MHPIDPKAQGNAWGEVRCENRLCPTYDETRRHGVSVRDGELVADERGSDAYKGIAIRRWNRWAE